MAIGIDCDDVLFPFVPHFCGFLKRKYGIDAKESNFSDYRFWKVYNVPREQAMDDVDEFGDTPAFRAIQPYPGAIEGVKKLKELDELLLITSRRNHYIEHTENQMNKFFPGMFSKILLGNSIPKYGKETRKRELCNQNNVWLMIEDTKTNAIEISRDIPVIMPAKTWNELTFGSNIIRLNETPETLWKRIPKVTRELARDPYCLL